MKFFERLTGTDSMLILGIALAALGFIVASVDPTALQVQLIP